MKMQKIVLEYHSRIDDQIKTTIHSRKISSLVKKAVNEEWYKIYENNSQIQKSKYAQKQK